MSSTRKNIKNQLDKLYLKSVLKWTLKSLCTPGRQPIKGYLLLNMNNVTQIQFSPHLLIRDLYKVFGAGTELKRT